MRKLLLLATMLICSVVAQSQTSSNVTLTWKASASSTTATPGAVSVFRAVGTCPATGIGTLTYQKVSTTAPAAGPFVDTAVSPSTTYCYYVTPVIGGISAAPSNTYQAVIPSAVAPVTIGGKVTQVTVTVTTN